MSTGSNYEWVEVSIIRYFTVHRIQLWVGRRKDYQICYCPQDTSTGGWKERLSNMLLSTESNYGWVEVKTMKHLTVHKIQLWVSGSKDYEIVYFTQDPIIGGWKERLSDISLST